jgi:hypothetical protein
MKQNAKCEKIMQNVSCHFYQPLNLKEGILTKGQMTACKKNGTILIAFVRADNHLFDAG